MFKNMKVLPNIKKLTKALIYLGAVAILAILYFSVLRQTNMKIENVKIVLESRGPDKLIANEDIINYIYRKTGMPIKNRAINDLDTREVENLLDNVSYIKKCEVFISADGSYNIHCILNDPLIRVSGVGKRDFYFDIDGNVIPVSRRATARVPLLTGNLKNIDFSQMKKEGTKANGILALGKEIHNDDFLNALIEQIYIGNDGKLILIPKVGSQKLVFGKLENINEKLDNLKIFYQTGMAGNGWRRFNRISLEWEGQVVGSI
jgi:cell division protein FtsQ